MSGQGEEGRADAGMTRRVRSSQRPSDGADAPPRRPVLVGVVGGAVLAVLLVGAVWSCAHRGAGVSDESPPPLALPVHEAVSGPSDASGVDGAGSAGGGAVCDPAVAGRDVTLPAICAERGALVATSSNGLGVRATWSVGADVTSCAAGVLASYGEAGDIALERDGYLDLFGNVWGCAVSSDEGWAEVAIVEGKGDGEGHGPDPEEGGGRCTVTVVRMGPGVRGGRL